MTFKNIYLKWQRLTHQIFVSHCSWWDPNSHTCSELCSGMCPQMGLARVGSQGTSSCQVGYTGWREARPLPTTPVAVQVAWVEDKLLFCSAIPSPIGGTFWGSCLRFRAGVWSHPELSPWCGTTMGEDTLCLLTLCSLAVIIVHPAPRQQMLSYGFRPQRDVCLFSEKRLIFNLPKVTSHSRWQMWNLRCSHSKALLPACWENQGRH